MKDQMIVDVENYANLLCSALYEDIKSNEISTHKQAIQNQDETRQDPTWVEYHKKKLVEIENNGVGHEFYIESGRKYHKVIHKWKDNGSQSVHAFIDKKTGDVYKPASWKAPAKHVRFNLLDDNSREKCLARCDWAGGYLYL